MSLYIENDGKGRHNSFTASLDVGVGNTFGTGSVSLMTYGCTKEEAMNHLKDMAFQAIAELTEEFDDES